jgi:dTDP-4-amino-4,6-dideoxygalactose transaminase
MAPYAPRVALDEVDRAAATSLALPMGPALSTEKVHEVAEVAVEILSR